jgi:transposase
MIGYFEGIESERGIAWRLKDSLSLRHFVGIALDEHKPDHSTISWVMKPRPTSSFSSDTPMTTTLGE